MMQRLGLSISTHLFQECSLCLVIKANQLLHHHHLPGLPVGHLFQDRQIKLSNKLGDMKYASERGKQKLQNVL